MISLLAAPSSFPMMRWPLTIKCMHKTFRNHLRHRQKDQAPKQSRVAMVPGFLPPRLLIFNLETSFSLHPPCLQSDVLQHLFSWYFSHLSLLLFLTHRFFVVAYFVTYISYCVSLHDKQIAFKGKTILIGQLCCSELKYSPFLLPSSVICKNPSLSTLWSLTLKRGYVVWFGYNYTWKAESPGNLSLM